MNVGYPEGFAAPWLKGLTALVVLLSVAISLLLMTILVAKKDMKVLLYKMMPPMVVKKLRRGETVVQRYDLSTIFFSDIVGFTKMSGGMSPLDVMDMLNDMYSKFDDLVLKHKLDNRVSRAESDIYRTQCCIFGWQEPGCNCTLTKTSNYPPFLLFAVMHTLSSEEALTIVWDEPERRRLLYLHWMRWRFANP